jgi:hypothetical protein
MARGFKASTASSWARASPTPSRPPVAPTSRRSRPRARSRSPATLRATPRPRRPRDRWDSSPARARSPRARGWSPDTRAFPLPSLEGGRTSGPSPETRLVAGKHPGAHP